MNKENLSPDNLFIAPEIPRDSSLQQKIWIESILKPSVEDQLKSIVLWRSRWSTVGSIAEVSSTFVAGVGTILAYTASFLKDQNSTLSLASGITGTIAIVLMTYAAFAKKKSKDANIKFQDIVKNWSTNVESLNGLVEAVSRKIPETRKM
jgi:hypothetical protein